MWSDILRGGRELMLAHALKMDTFSHAINGTKGASHPQAAASAARRVYVIAGVR